MKDRLTTPLQESILSLLATNSTQGKVAAGLLEAKSFDEPYQDFATRVIQYQRKHGKAPGKAHLDDLVDDVIGDPDNTRHQQTIRILEGVLAAADSLNPDYLISRISEFAHTQQWKGALIEMNERWQQGGENLIQSIETAAMRAIRFQPENMDAGVFLSDKKKSLQFLDHLSNLYSTGIPAFDRAGFGPTAGEILLFIGPKGIGKSWWCVDTGRRCLMQGAKVVHITLELRWEMIVQRYYQNFFAMTQTKHDYDVPTLRIDDKKGIMTGLHVNTLTPAIYLESHKIRKELMKRIDDWSAKFERLVVKQFPTGSLTVEALEAYLDYLELTEGFIPTVLVIDYPDLMELKGDIRLATGNTFKALRGLCQRRNLCGVMPTQTSKLGWEASTVRASMIAEDSSKVMTADMTMLCSRTEEEKKRGLARLTVAHHRRGRDKFSVVITQSYESGQFMLSSVPMPNDYWKITGMSPNKEAEEAKEIENGKEDEDDDADRD